jgi:methylenetetrahydrofolate--tRNA-(uracil-5-)-methyltransferase
VKKKIRDKRERHRLVCNRALDAFEAWWRTAQELLAQPAAL